MGILLTYMVVKKVQVMFSQSTCKQLIVSVNIPCYTCRF